MKRMVMGAALLATLAAVWFAPDPDGDTDDVSQPVVRSGGRANPASGVPGPSVAGPAAGRTGTSAQDETRVGGFDLRIHPREAGDEMGNLFGAAEPPPAPIVSARPPPRPKVKPGPPPPPAAPQAPPLPFQYLGRWIGEGKVAFFLQFNGRNLVLHEGEMVDQTWKLEQAGAGQLTFVYLPLNQKQSLAVGDVN